MSQAIKEKSVYREAFAKAGREGEPSWLARLREGAIDRFEELGFPTAGQEDWKYTNVAPVARAGFGPAAGAGGALGRETVERFVSEEARRSRLVFVDGRLSPELSALEDLGGGVVAVGLAEAARGEHAALVREKLEASVPRGGAFESLNAALTAGGALVLVPRGARAAAPLQLLFLSTEAESASFPRVVVVAERDSSLDLIESYAAAGPHAYLTDAVVEVSVGEGARVTHYKVQGEGEGAFHVASTRAAVGRDSVYDLTTITLGARLSRHDIEVRLAAEGAQCHVDGLYIVGAGQHTDTHSLIDHLRPHGASRQNYKGILDGKSRAVFNGRVFVHRDAQQTDAVQSNKNLLLSPEARVDTKPQLEIFADDVKCAHGATVGQLEEEELFYLLSRGLHPDLARNLLTYGFAEEIVKKIKFDSIRAQLDESILNRLHARLEV